METVVLVAQHRNQYYNRGKPRTSKDFRVINCRTFESSAGIIRSPGPCNGHLQRTPPSFYSERKNKSKSKILIVNTPPSPKGAPLSGSSCCSELWAGPACTNSPPPSSLPFPNFSLRQKRSVSLEIQIPKSVVAFRSLSKSTTSSPSSETPSSDSDFLFNPATATENLRRILHLDVAMIE